MSGAFTFDTSGSVRVPGWTHSDHGPATDEWFWGNLSPFVQGYIEAALRSQVRVDHTGQEQPFFLAIRSPGIARWRRVGFRHLAPDTLAAILKDCEEAIVGYTQPNHAKTCAHLGREFWQDRQRGALCALNRDNTPRFPPLTLSLSDDGKVRMEARS